MNKPYAIDFTTNTVTVTKKFQEAASMIGTTEFNTMMQLRQMNLTIVTKAPAKKKGKLTYDKMKKYIALLVFSKVCISTSHTYLVTPFCSVDKQVSDKTNCQTNDNTSVKSETWDKFREFCPFWNWVRSLLTTWYITEVVVEEVVRKFQDNVVHHNG